MAFRHALFVFFSQGVQQYSPTECTEPTESLGGAAVSAAPTKQIVLCVLCVPWEYFVLPQNSRNSQNRLAEGVLPQNSRNSQNRLAEDVLPQNSRNAQKLLVEDILPRISQMATDL